jgi:hypothetical protein
VIQGQAQPMARHLTLLALLSLALLIGGCQTFPQNGQGTMTNGCGGTYIGEFKDGKSNGQGTGTCANGDKHIGQYKDSKLNGQGTSIFANGSKYVGEYKDDKYNGQGTYIHANGDKYVGDFKDGKYNGQGTFTRPNGEKYVGEFKDDKYNRKGTFNFANGDKYGGEFKDGKWNGQGTYSHANGNKYVGEWKDGNKHGQGTYSFANGDKHVGEFKDDKRHGKGIETYADGNVKEGIWADDMFVRAEKVNLPPVNQQTDVAVNEERRKLDADRQALEEDRQRLTEERNRREQSKQSSKLSLQTTTTNPDANGVVIISVRTNADTSSLKVNGEEQGGRPDGNYVIKKVARVGQDTNYVITAIDSNGSTETTTITVARQAVSSSSNQTASLKPENIKRAASRDAVAIIIGIQNYKRVPKAEFANNDAKEFYEYAIRGLGIKPENIKLLLDEEADEVELYKAFQNWLPLQVTKNKTDVYVFYSGHGLPAPDGKSLYFLPHGVDKQFIEKTAVSQQEVIAALVASKPKSVTMFIDACYSGQTRSGEMMIASVRPLTVKSEASVYPSNFTVISASSNDQYSSSSPELKHGIFSFYLMKGMEGDADGNKDGKITAGEMQEYLSDKVSRQAMSMSRKQDTQLVGDANKVLMGR